jgi:hypothetical protein
MRGDAADVDRMVVKENTRVNTFGHSGPLNQSAELERLDLAALPGRMIEVSASCPRPEWDCQPRFPRD